MQSQCNTGDQAKSAARATEELAEVEPGDVLHDVAAAAYDLAATIDELETEHEIAWQSKARCKRTRRTGCDRRADGAVVGAMRVEREPLVVLARNTPDIVE